MRKKVSIITGACLFLCVLCLGCGNRGSDGHGTSQSAAGPEAQSPAYLHVVTLKKGDRISVDNAEKFIQLAILYYHYQKQWINEINTNTNVLINPEEYLARKREAFYAEFGIRETDFTSYYTRHIKEVNDFLEKHPEYKQAYEESAQD